MKCSHFYTILLALFLLPAPALRAQTGTRVKASLDRTSILIGEPLKLTLQVEVPQNDAIRFFTIDTLPHFEILERQKRDTSDTDDGTVITQVLRITSFDSGHWVIPAFVLDEGIATDSLAVDVTFTEGFNPEQEYHDIRNIIDVNPEKEKDRRWIWFAIAGGVLLLGVILYFVFRKKKPAPAVVVPALGAYETAMQELERLQKQSYGPKEYYTRLTDIFRAYVAKKKGIHSLQKTTDDLVLQLRALALPKGDFDLLAQNLRLGDFVKFAKYAPSKEEDQAAFDTIKKMISAIEQLPHAV